MALQPYVFPTVPSPQVKVVQECLKRISEFDIDGLNSLMTDDFTLKMLPVNLGVPDRTKAVAFAGLKEMQAALNGKPLAYTVYDVTDGQGKTWVHAKMDPLDLELIYCFQFDEGVESPRITSMKEFIDSKRYMEVNPIKTFS